MVFELGFQQSPRGTPRIISHHTRICQFCAVCGSVPRRVFSQELPRRRIRRLQTRSGRPRRGTEHGFTIAPFPETRLKRRSPGKGSQNIYKKSRLISNFPGILIPSSTEETRFPLFLFLFPLCSRRRDLPVRRIFLRCRLFFRHLIGCLPARTSCNVTNSSL